LSTDGQTTERTPNDPQRSVADGAIQVGIIGLGTVGLHHAEALQRLGCNIAGAVTRQPERRRRAEQEFGAVVYDDVTTMLTAARLDAVVVASPNADHYAHVCAALAAGCHVLCEKPLATTEAEVVALIEAANKARRHLTVGYNLRHTGSFRTAFDLARTELGSIHSVEAQWVRRRGIPALGRWSTTRQYAGGGALLDIGIHVLDAAWQLAGRPMPIAVSGTTVGLYRNRIDAYQYKSMWNGPPVAGGVMDVEDSSIALLRLETDVTMMLDVAWARNAQEVPCSVSIAGTQAGLHWTKGGPTRLISDAGTETRDPAVANDLTMYHAFISATGSENLWQPDLSAFDSVVMHRIIDGIYLSAQEGHEVSLKGSPFNK
jgi:predicted dehydrogenase